MLFLRRFIDFCLVVFVIAWFNWLLALLPEGSSSVYRLAVIINHIYFSLYIVFSLAIFILGLLALITLSVRWSKGFYWQRGAAESSYFYAGIIILVGFFRLLLSQQGGYGTDPLWLTAIVLWVMFGGWFWLHKSLKAYVLARSLYTSIYSLLIAVVFPLAATAFSFWDLTPSSRLFIIEHEKVLLIATGICFLIIVRIYTHCLKMQRLAD